MRGSTKTIREQLADLRNDLSDVTHDIDEYDVAHGSHEDYNLDRSVKLEQERKELYKQIAALESQLKNEAPGQASVATVGSSPNRR